MGDKGDEGQYDRNKFKKVEMQVFSGDDPNGWLSRADRYFQIHWLSDSEKVIVAVISFEEAALSWYRTVRKHENKNSQIGRTLKSDRL